MKFNPFKRKPVEPPAPQFLTPAESKRLDDLINGKTEVAMDILPPVKPKKKQPKGGVRRVSKRAEYKPGGVPGRGRVLKAMPRDIRRVKESQERVEHETDE
jgi:hypothetical protein